MKPIAQRGPKILWAEDPDLPGLIENTDTGETVETPVSVYAFMSRGYWYPIEKPGGLNITKRLSRAFGNKRLRNAQQVARLKRKRGYAPPVVGGTGKQGRTRRKKFAKHGDHDQSTHGNWADGVRPLGGDHPRRENYYRFELNDSSPWGDGKRIFAMDGWKGETSGVVHVTSWDMTQEIIGQLGWNKDGVIDDVWVRPRFRRQGVATSMLAMARDMDPRVEHSTALTASGRAWSSVAKHTPGGVDHDQMNHGKKGPGIVGFDEAVGFDEDVPYHAQPDKFKGSLVDVKQVENFNIANRYFNTDATALAWAQTHPGDIAYSQETGSLFEARADIVAPAESVSTTFDGKMANTLSSRWGIVSVNGEVTQSTDQGLLDVMSHMESDPRWEKAQGEWEQLDDVLGSTDVVYEIAEGNANSYHMLANSVNYDDGGSESGPWNLMDYYEENIHPIGDDMTEYSQLNVDGVPLDGEYVPEIGETVHTSMVASAYDNVGHLTNPRWVYMGTRSDGTAILEQSEAPLGMLVDWNGELVPRVPDSISSLDPKDLVTVGMGPKRMYVLGNTLFPAEAQVTRWGTTITADTEVLILDDHAEFGEQISSLTSSWEDFESDFGVSPQNAIYYLEAGDLTQFESFGDATPTGLDTLMVDDSYGKTGMSYVTDPSDVPLVMRNLWANTAMDENRWSVALQMATQDEFGLDAEIVSERGRMINLEAQDTYEKYGTGLRVYSRAVYDTTQDWLAGQGLTSWPLYRGMKLDTDSVQDIWPEAEDTDLFQERSVGSIDTFNQNWRSTSIEMNPLSSWSVDFGEANKFAKSSGTRHAVLVRSMIPVEQVWGSSMLGHGSYREREIITLGKDQPGEVLIAPRNLRSPQ